MSDLSNLFGAPAPLPSPSPSPLPPPLPTTPESVQKIQQPEPIVGIPHNTDNPLVHQDFGIPESDSNPDSIATPEPKPASLSEAVASLPPDQDPDLTPDSIATPKFNPTQLPPVPAINPLSASPQNFNPDDSFPPVPQEVLESELPDEDPIEKSLNTPLKSPGTEKNTLSAPKKKSKKQIAAESAPKTFAEAASATQIDKTFADKTIPSGSIVIDKILPGGWPVGFIYELYGEEGSSKTTQMLAMAKAAVSRLNRYVLYLDFEHTVDERMEKSMKINPITVDDITSNSERLQTPNIILLKPETAEQGENLIELCTQEYHPVAIVIDSLPGMIPKILLEAKTGTVSQKGVCGSFYSTFFNKQTKFTKRYNYSLFVVNQSRVRLQIGNSTGMSQFAGINSNKGQKGPIKDSFSSATLKYYAACRSFLLKKREFTKEFTDPYTGDTGYSAIGAQVELRFDKTKLFAGTPINVYINYGHGYDNISSLRDILIALDYFSGTNFYAVKIPGLDYDLGSKGIKACDFDKDGKYGQFQGKEAAIKLLYHKNNGMVALEFLRKEGML